VISSDLPRCGCPGSREGGEHPERAWHRQLILVLSRLDEQQRRWVAQITGLDEKTIRRGREELAGSLVDRPVDRVRLPGGGRPASEIFLIRAR